MHPEDDQRLLELADRVGSREAVAWQDEFLRSRGADELKVMESLQILGRIGTLHRSQSLDPTSFGRLQLLEEIGRGSFGRVHRAHDPALQRDVALKLLDSERTARHEERDRILAEARCLASLRHQNVVTVHGVEEHEGRVGFWMELIDGSSLWELHQRDGNLGEGELRHVARTLASAVAALHGAGVLHRDIKPQNVLRERGGRLVLMDLGAGSRVEVEGGPSVGTPLYLAPELLRDGHASQASDLYALGVTLFYLASGRHPYEAPSLHELRSKQERGDRLALADLRPDLSAELCQVVERCLATTSSERWRSAGHLAGALGAPSARAHGALSRRSILLASAAVIVLATLAAVGIGGLFGGHESFSVQAAVFRYTASGREELDSGASLRADDALGLRVQSPRTLHVYVLNRDQAGNSHLLFPLQGMDQSNPLPGGIEYQLPGSVDGEPRAWGLSESGGAEELLLIASPEPVRVLEEMLAELPAAAPGEAIELGDRSERVLRGLGRVVAPPSREESTASGLWDAVDLLIAGEQRAEGLWIRRFHYRSDG